MATIKPRGHLYLFVTLADQLPGTEPHVFFATDSPAVAEKLCELCTREFTGWNNRPSFTYFPAEFHSMAEVILFDEKLDEIDGVTDPEPAGGGPRSVIQWQALYAARVKKWNTRLRARPEFKSSIAKPHASIEPAEIEDKFLVKHQYTSPDDWRTIFKNGENWHHFPRPDTIIQRVLRLLASVAGQGFPLDHVARETGLNVERPEESFKGTCRELFGPRGIVRVYDPKNGRGNKVEKYIKMTDPH